ncbi:extracellular matrix protein 1 isoform X2 [Triplophysa dalaica]|uniref:extracellular matrix protein 1 isoform X2 n=1 Tax=Triplophysa dalaica TaxID=1582913 RepID=UPI0024DFB61C|nr:extracellular matrix protein 1 isoform X2 [Triplophysa dalaica]
MSSLRDIGLHLILALVFVCEAAEDPEPQREMIHVFDRDGLQRAVTREELEDMMGQRPVIPDISEFIKMQETDVIQPEATNFHPEDAPRGPPLFGPRSMGPNGGPEIHFPPSFPSISNLEDVCQFSNTSIRYPKDIFPPSGFGAQHRQAEAVNRLQPWYGMCCGLNGTEEEKLCCAEQAWKKTLSAFCDEEFSIKTVAYFCCKMNGKDKWSCFDKHAPATSYDVPIIDKIDMPIKVKGFKYNPSSCKGALEKQAEIVDICFPPGRPHSSNIDLICGHRKIRPRYLTRCLPHTGYGWLARQSKAINVLEKEYGQCCKEKKGQHNCAERKWKKMVDKFCKDEKKTKGKDFECCDKKKREEMYSCFASSAPDPAYIMTNAVIPPPTLESFCDVQTSLQSVTEFPVEQIVERCCSLVSEERSSCVEAELDSSLNDLCEVKELEKPYCCETTIKNRAKCATKLLLRYMAKANKVKFSGNKKCPLIERQMERDN